MKARRAESTVSAWPLLGPMACRTRSSWLKAVHALRALSASRCSSSSRQSDDMWESPYLLQAVVSCTFQAKAVLVTHGTADPGVSRLLLLAGAVE